MGPRVCKHTRGLSMRTVLVIERHAIAITSEAEEISGLMEYMFSPWHGQRKEAECNISIEKESHGYHITVPEIYSSSVNGASLVSVIEQVITDLACELLRDYMQIHAAVIDFRGTGVMISGPHGTGKTTLVLTALSTGCTILSDEVAMYKRDDRSVIGFPLPFRVCEGTRALRPSIIPKDCPRSESPDGIMHLHFSAPGLQYYQPNTRIRYLLFPLQRPGQTVLRKLGEREALVRILPQGYNFHLHGNGLLSDLLDLIRHIQPMEMLYSDHWHALHTLKKMVLRQQ